MRLLRREERTMRGLVVLGALTLFGGSFAFAEEKVDAKAAGAGRGLFLQYCTSCHGTDAKGAGPAAASLKAPVPDLTTLPQKNGKFDEARVRTSIEGTQAKTAHGTRDMPVWGKVFESRPTKPGAGWAQTDIWNLTQYIQSIQAPVSK
jgi:mono/diheme cytochrome c family protein